MHIISFMIFTLTLFTRYQLATTGRECILACADFCLKVFHDLNLQTHQNSWDMHALGTVTFKLADALTTRCLIVPLSTVKDLSYSPKL